VEKVLQIDWIKALEWQMPISIEISQRQARIDYILVPSSEEIGFVKSRLVDFAEIYAAHSLAGEDQRPSRSCRIFQIPGSNVENEIHEWTIK
jgi:hypothetical protein